MSSIIDDEETYRLRYTFRLQARESHSYEIEMRNSLFRDKMTKCILARKKQQEVEDYRDVASFQNETLLHHEHRYCIFVQSHIAAHFLLSTGEILREPSKRDCLFLTYRVGGSVHDTASRWEWKGHHGEKLARSLEGISKCLRLESTARFVCYRAAR